MAKVVHKKITPEEFGQKVEDARRKERKNPFFRDEEAVKDDLRELQVRKESRKKTMVDFWLEQGWCKRSNSAKARAFLAEDGVTYVTLALGKWGDSEIRKRAVRFLVEEVLKKNPKNLTAKDFIKNGFGGLLDRYEGSPYEALIDAGFKLKPWEMKMCPMGFYEKKENRITAIKWLVDDVLKKDPRDITVYDFHKNGLRTVLKYYDSHYETLKDAGYEFYPWEMKHAPNIYADRDVRIAATKWLVEKLKKNPRKINNNDFKKNGLDGVLARYGDSAHKALVEAGFDIKPWEMETVSPGFWLNKQKRIDAVRWLVDEVLKKDIGKITAIDFRNNGMGSIFRHNGSIYSALNEAGYAVQPWELKSVPHGVYRKKENRINAIKWLAEKLKKDAKEITVRDFRINGFGTLLAEYYGCSPFRAFFEAGLVSEKDEEYMRSKGHTR